MEFLREHHWPGNIRELENMMERAVIMAESEMLTLEDSFDMLPQAAAPREAGPAMDAGGGLLSIEDYIREAILRYQDEYSDLDLAAMLGIGRKALWMRRRRWGLMKDRGRGDDAIVTAQRKVS